MKLFIKLLPDQSPGNSVVLTTAIRDLKRANPGWKLNVGGGVVRDFFQNNPNIDSSVTEKTADKIVTAEYPFRGSLTKHYLYSYTESICFQLGIRIKRGEFRPELFLSKAELSSPRKITEPYWILNSGYRTNISAKYWGDEHFRQLVFEFKNKIKFVQIGGKSNDLQNPPLSGTIDLRGKTSFRELMLLIYHSEGVVSLFRCRCTLRRHFGKRRLSLPEVGSNRTGRGMMTRFFYIQSAVWIAAGNPAVSNVGFSRWATGKNSTIRFAPIRFSIMENRSRIAWRCWMLKMSPMPSGSAAGETTEWRGFSHRQSRGKITLRPRRN